MKQWFLSREQNEQLVIAILAALVVLALIWLMLLKPLEQQAATQNLRQQALITELEQVQQLTLQYQQLSNQDTVQQPSQSNLTLPQLVDRTVAEQGLTLQRYQPSSSGSAQVRFENMPQDKILAWLYDMEINHGIGFKDLSLTAGSEAGLVNLTVRLTEAGS